MKIDTSNKMANSMTVLVILLVTMTVVTCQTFQYSHGWTNGKRADPGIDGGPPAEFRMNFPIQDTIRRSNDPDIHCGLTKLRMLLRGNNNNQLYHLPCELLNILSRDVEDNQRIQQKNSHRFEFYDNNHDDNNN